MPYQQFTNGMSFTFRLSTLSYSDSFFSLFFGIKELAVVPHIWPVLEKIYSVDYLGTLNFFN